VGNFVSPTAIFSNFLVATIDQATLEKGLYRNKSEFQSV
jgi:hypothetical protein